MNKSKEARFQEDEQLAQQASISSARVMSWTERFDFDTGAFVCFALDFLLADFEDDVLGSVIPDEPSISEAVNVVFWAKVVWIDEATPQADNADSNAIWIFFFSLALAQWLIANRAFKLGTGCLTISISVPCNGCFAGIGKTPF